MWKSSEETGSYTSPRDGKANIPLELPSEMFHGIFTFPVGRRHGNFSWLNSHILNFMS